MMGQKSCNFKTLVDSVLLGRGENDFCIERVENGAPFYLDFSSLSFRL